MTGVLHPDPLFDIACSKMNSAMLEVARDLKVFDCLKDRRLSLTDASAAWGLPETSGRVLSQFLCGLGLLSYRNGFLENTALVEAYLVNESLGWDVIDMHAMFGFGADAKAVKEKLLNPPVLDWYRLRDGDVSLKKAGIEEAFYTAPCMQAWRMMLAREMAQYCDLSKNQQLLDVGGGAGSWCIGLREVYPHLNCVVFDLPEVCNIARSALGEAHKNITVEEGDFFHDSLPEGADIVLLANILHDWTIQDGRLILSAVFDALEPGGKVLVWEFFAQDNWSGGTWPAVHAMTVIGTAGKSGWQPAYGEVEALLTEAGFVDVERHPNLVMAFKPQVQEK